MTDTERAFEYIEVNWAAFDGAQSVLVRVLENERHGAFGLRRQPLLASPEAQGDAYRS